MPQQWEYCAVGPDGEKWFYRFPLGGAPVPIKRDRNIKGDKDWLAAFRLMDRLGAEGWELVSVSGQYGNRFYFKRPAASPQAPTLQMPAPTV